MSFVHHVHAARDDRSGHCARICDSRVSISGGTIAGTAAFAHVVCVPVPFTVKSWSTSCDRAASHAGCRLSPGCAWAQAAKDASMASSASMNR